MTSWFFVEVNTRYRRDQWARVVHAQRLLDEVRSDQVRKPWLALDWLIWSRWPLRRTIGWVCRGFLRRPTRLELTGDFTRTGEVSDGDIKMRAHGISK